MSLSLITPLSTETAKVETPVTARLRQPVVVDGFTVVPAGATLHGDVIEAERAGRVKGRSRLVIRFAEVMVNGDRDPFRTDELTFEGQASKAKDATKIGAGAGIGALIGGMVGNRIGAAMDERFHAFDKLTGELLWEFQMEAGGYATPSTFEVAGRQYVVIAAGGGGKPGTRPGNAYYCFALGD